MNHPEEKIHLSYADARLKWKLIGEKERLIDIIEKKTTTA